MSKVYTGWTAPTKQAFAGKRSVTAQLLSNVVEVNHPIPDKSYAAVAEVLAYVYQQPRLFRTLRENSL